MISLIACGMLTAVCAAGFMGNKKAQLQRVAEREREKKSAEESVSVTLDVINQIFG